MKVIDNFLPQEQFLIIKNEIMSVNFPWFYQDKKVYENDHYFQFIHTFYKNYQVNSNYFSLLKPIIDIINAKALVGIKANCNPKTENTEIYNFHVDEKFEGFTGLYYINTNNGYTLFKNKDKVESIENRFLIFKNELEHTGTSCTDQKARFVINFNYI